MSTNGANGARGPPNDPTGPPAVAAEDVTLTYADGTRALDGLSLRVQQGELFELLGPNGAGKTTTIRLLTGRAAPDVGELSVLGTDPETEGARVRERVGILPEKEEPHSFQTAREYLRFVGRTRDLADRTVDRQIGAWADRLQFREKLDTLSTDLSRGQQQKVMIAAAFLHDPELVFVDEPLANLDPIVQRRVEEFLRAYAAAGNTLLLSTHHVGVAERLCTRVGIVEGGQLVAVRDLEANDPDLIELFEDAVGSAIDREV